MVVHATLFVDCYDWFVLFWIRSMMKHNRNNVNISIQNTENTENIHKHYNLTMTIAFCIFFIFHCVFYSLYAFIRQVNSSIHSVLLWRQTTSNSHFVHDKSDLPTSNIFSRYFRLSTSVTKRVLSKFDTIFTEGPTYIFSTRDD